MGKSKPFKKNSDSDKREPRGSGKFSSGDREGGSFRKDNKDSEKRDFKKSSGERSFSGPRRKFSSDNDQDRRGPKRDFKQSSERSFSGPRKKFSDRDNDRQGGGKEGRGSRFSKNDKPFGDRPKRDFQDKNDSFKGPRNSDNRYERKGRDEDDKPRERKSFVDSRIEKQRRGGKNTEDSRVESGDGLIRLNKFISNSGVCSRREADELIAAGLITVNGKSVVELGYKVKPTDDVRYEGKRLKAEKPVYILLNKPKGFITTTDDPQERNTVMQLIAGACRERVYPVGRLDRNTSGLLLLTNDGDLTEKLSHPSHGVKKIYKAELDRPLEKNDFQKILSGVRLEEGKAIVDDLAIVSDDGKTVGLEIHIGWNRVIRRIFEAVGYEVVKLDRSVYATLDKKELPRGNWRFLREEEVVRLKHFL